jgi:hypothetical protein
MLHLYIAWEPGQLSWYSVQAMGWITADSWFVLPFSSLRAPESTQPPVQWVSDIFYPGVKRAGRETYHSSPSSAWASILFMAKGHTRCCGLVRGQHVKNNKWYY